MSSASFTDRDQLWRDIESGEAGDWDIVVAGGGITGSGIFREAVQRGYRTLLIEQRDFAWGTSSRSSKMVHGGLRYLAAGNVSLTRHALQERERLISEAPNLVRRLAYYFPLYKGKFPPRLAAGFLFWLYDRMAGVSDHRPISNAQLSQKFNGLDTGTLNGAFYYTDAVTDDARLALRIMHESVQAGGVLRNYTRGTRVLRDGNRVVGLRIEDTESGKTLDLSSRVVINATGAWADRFRDPPPKGIRIRPQRGSHLVLCSRQFPVSAAIFLLHPDDGRRLFVYPWENRTIVGTTDIYHPEELDTAASITPAELDYLLRAAAQLYKDRPPTRDDVISTWSGVRPILVSGNPDSPSKASREHKVWSEEGLVGCSGGKLTTFHHMALDVMDRAQEYLPVSAVPADQRIFNPVQTKPDSLLPGNAERARLLLGRFGDDAGEVLSQAAAGELDPLLDTGISLAELRWSLRNESVLHLDDLMLRRSRLGLLLRDGGAELLGRIEPLCRDCLGWDEDRWAGERERYRDIIGRFHSVPEPG
jgi:glycerol-3-phosphate dehydrogenase